MVASRYFDRNKDLYQTTLSKLRIFISNIFGCIFIRFYGRFKSKLYVHTSLLFYRYNFDSVFWMYLYKGNTSTWVYVKTALNCGIYYKHKVL